MEILPHILSLSKNMKPYTCSPIISIEVDLYIAERAIICVILKLYAPRECRSMILSKIITTGEQSAFLHSSVRGFTAGKILN